ncbi:hypothetical protein [Streptomyces acidiscabies]|uniref:Uncharacterized protein n=1 Tax=Streptomyces acidiscabies TaxID=42234 RepID=A0ABU4M9G9_9ACTN|nr:hypothetical protein [Streptomyces acidiscabies]MBP5938558.1 hypothetical protein [Streptomyces sp. LBUM 1476]MDX3024543.1 hypothetical protein [Streptomyces acidiscabies]
MSAGKYLVVTCDAASPRDLDGECSAEAHWPLRVDTHTELRRLLHTQRGWHTRPGGRDICPDCWKAGRR